MSESEAKQGSLKKHKDKIQRAPGRTQDNPPAVEDEEKQRKSKAKRNVTKGEKKSKMTSQPYFGTSTNEITHPEAHALSQKWVFGMNPSLPIFSLQDHNQLVLLYAACNFGVLYNHTLNSRHFLQGHSESISCMCVSEDRRWIATGEKSSKGIVIIWDSYSGVPVHNTTDLAGGVVALAFSSDTKHLVTLGREEAQLVCIWDWTSDAQQPLVYTKLNPKHCFQDYIAFKPNDNTQLLSSNKNYVLFYRMAKGRLQYFAQKLKKPSPHPIKSVHINGASLSLSAFHCTEPMIITASGTFIVTWDVSKVDDPQLSLSSVRRFKWLQNQITVLTVIDGSIVTGDVGGHIYFWDENFKIFKWFTNFNLEPIVFISFSKESKEGYLEDRTLKAGPITIRNFIVTTISSKVVHVNAETCTLQTLLDEDYEPVCAVTCHPCKPAAVTGNQRGILRVWDYNNNVVINSKDFKTEGKIQCMTFDPKGSYLAVGFGNGAVHILNALSLQSNPEECFHCTTRSIHLITFSSDSQYLATADAGEVVTVFRFQSVEGSVPRWMKLGRYGSHYRPITDLLFGVHLDSTQPRLFSLGLDRRLVEYDLENSDTDKLLILSSDFVEQIAMPLCMTWYPPLTPEQFLLIGSDRFKLKLFNSTDKMCRKTLQGPVSGSPIKKMVVLPKDQEPEMKSYYLAYITDKMLGLQILPLDGNPHKSSALLCNPVEVSDFACSYDGRYIFTVGGSDCCTLMWEINLKVLDAAAELGGQDMEPFYNLLEGGKDGGFLKEMKDFFCYCQIRHQTSDMTPRRVTTKIHLSEVPFLMRALGHFPTEKEIEDIKNEVKFSKYAETGKYVTDIDLEEFIKLYVNHRLAPDILSKELIQAFKVLGEGDGTEPPVLKTDELMELLQVKGERMTEEEIAESFTTLLGLNEEEFGEDSKCSIPDEISIGKILGLSIPDDQ